MTDIILSRGLDLSAQFVVQPDSGQMSLSAEGILTVTRKWKTNYDYALSATPFPRSADPGGPGGSTNGLCCNVDITPIPPNMALITATYQGYFTLPYTIYEFQNARMDRPIEMHPDFLNTSVFPVSCKNFDPVKDSTGAEVGVAFAGFKTVGTSPDTDFRGIESYVVGNAMWRKTSFATSPDFSQTDVGKLAAPECGAYGVTVPDASNSGKHWLKVNKNCRNSYRGASLLWEISEDWLYNSLAWDPHIYS